MKKKEAMGNENKVVFSSQESKWLQSKSNIKIDGLSPLSKKKFSEEERRLPTI